MNNPFDNVKDSSIWYTPNSLSTINTLDTRLYIGIIREAYNAANTNELRYLVEIRHKNDTILSNCRMLRQHGGAYNYEDYIMQGYNYNAATDNQNGATAIAGDVVLVGQFAGQGREGIILGSLTHLARKSFLDIKKGPQYKSEFNGIETYINEDGEWLFTFKGQPTNKDKLNATPSQPIPVPEYDKDVGSSYMKWDKTGSYTLSARNHRHLVSQLRHAAHPLPHGGLRATGRKPFAPGLRRRVLINGIYVARRRACCRARAGVSGERDGPANLPHGLQHARRDL